MEGVIDMFHSGWCISLFIFCVLVLVHVYMPTHNGYQRIVEFLVCLWQTYDGLNTYHYRCLGRIVSGCQESEKQTAFGVKTYTSSSIFPSTTKSVFGRLSSYDDTIPGNLDLESRHIIHSYPLQRSLLTINSNNRNTHAQKNQQQKRLRY